MSEGEQGMSGPEQMPGGKPPEPINQEGLPSQEILTPEQMKLRELSMGIAEMLKNPELGPDAGRELIVFELLFPRESNEKEPESIEPWLARPVIDVLTQRAYSGYFLDRLQSVPGLPQSYLERYKKSGEGSREWEKVLHQTEAAIRLQNVFAQRSPLESDVDTYAEKLFQSAGYLKTLPPSMIGDLLTTPDYGPAIEKALRLVVDIHLGLVKETADGKPLVKILQEENSTEEDRKKFATILEEQLVKEGTNPFIAKRAVILAKHLATTTLLSVWLGGERNKDGKLAKLGKEEKPSGNCSFYLEQQSDLIKLFYFRGKTLDDLSKGRPAGPQVLSEAAPEYLTTDFFHHTKTGPKESSIPVFDRWYKNGESLAGVLEEVSETAYASWVYCMYRQNRVRRILWENKSPDMVLELANPESLRAINKDISIGAGELTSKEKEDLKIRLVAGRLLATGVTTERMRRKTRVEMSALPVLESLMRSLGESTEEGVVKQLEQACETAGFFSDPKYAWKKIREHLKKQNLS